MIDISNVSLQLQGKSILSNITATIPANAITAILGPNGAGKSSLLKCLTGGLDSYLGSIKIGSADLKTMDIKNLSRKRAVLSQQLQVAFPFSVEEIVKMGRIPFLNSSQPDQGTDIVHEALEVVDAQHLKDRLFSSLSGGEQQRVQLARVLTQMWTVDDACLFLDEPTSALDLKHQFEVLNLLHSLCTERQFTVVVILHDLNLARMFADHVLILKEGNLYASGTSDTIISPEMAKVVYGVSMKYAIDPDSEVRSLFYAEKKVS